MPQKLDGKSSLELVPQLEPQQHSTCLWHSLEAMREQGFLVILGNVFALNDNIEVPKMRDDPMQTMYAMNHWELQSYLVLAWTQTELFRNRIREFCVVQHKVFKRNRRCSMIHREERK